MSSGDFIDRIEHIDGIFNVYVNHETINVLPKTPKQLDEMLRFDFKIDKTQLGFISLFPQLP